MGRIRSCRRGDGGANNKGAWTAGEDKLLIGYMQTHGGGSWKNVPAEAGLRRCGKSCRLRWLNYLRPDIKRGNFTIDEEDLIFRLHRLLGNKWSLIAKRLPGRTDNEVKNYWNSCLSKKQNSRHPKASKNHSQYTFPAIVSDEPPIMSSPAPEDCTSPEGFDPVRDYVVEEPELSPGSSALDFTISFDIGEFVFPELLDFELDGELRGLDAGDVKEATAGTPENGW